MKRFFALITICFVIVLSACSNKVTDTVQESDSYVAASNESIEKENKAVTEEQTEVISDIQTTGKVENDLAHERYLKEIEKNEESEVIYDFDFTEYAFFDIDGNGIDELITSDGLFAYIIYTYSDNEIIDLLHIKRGWGEIKIYADSKCVFSTGGNTDSYYDAYDKINGNKSEQLACKTWYVTHESDTESSTQYEYSVMGKPVKKNEYKDYVKSITQSNAITHKDLEWIKVLKN